MLKAYCSGINYYVDHHLHTFPIEFWITGERSNFEPFTVIDSLSIIRLYAFAMSFGFQHALVRHSLIEIFGEGRGGCWANTSGDYGEDDDDDDDGDNDDENGKDKGNNNSNNDHEKDNMKMKNKKEYKMPFTVDSEAFEAFRKVDLSGVKPSKKPPNPPLYSFPSDIYSTGVIALELWLWCVYYCGTTI